MAAAWASSVVYAARDTKLGRRAALKFLPPQWSHDEGGKQRFIREAQAASATDHSNICTIHDIVTAADGQLLIVMAHYDGQTLKQRLEGGCLPVDEAVEVTAQMTEGLAKAQAHPEQFCANGFNRDLTFVIYNLIIQACLFTKMCSPPRGAWVRSVGIGPSPPTRSSGHSRT